MNFKLLSLFILTIALTSCQQKKIYDDFDDAIPNQRWQKTSIKTFEFIIDQEARNYDVNVHFAYLSDFVVNSVPMIVTIIHPNGTAEKKEINIIVKDKEGKETGDCGGDYCDIREAVFANEALPSGNYTIKIQQQFNGPYLPNVNGIGIEVVAKAD